MLEAELRQAREQLRNLHATLARPAEVDTDEKKAKRAYKQGSVLGNIDLDEEGGKTVAQQVPRLSRLYLLYFILYHLYCMLFTRVS